MFFFMSWFMRPRYDARVSDIGPSDLGQIACTRCDHSELLTATMLKTAGLQPYEVIMRLGRRFRCRVCDERGHVDISIRWADA